jgi:hypothetical protein
VVDPYDRRINDLEWEERAALSEQIAEALEKHFGPLEGRALEIHAGQEYQQMLRVGLRSRGAILRNPLQGMRIGEQLRWYAEQAPPWNRPADTAIRAPAPARSARPGHPGLASEITEVFMDGTLDLSKRPGAPLPDWEGMPELVAAARLGKAGASQTELRLVATFTAAMDRARDADRLWRSAALLFEKAPWTFDPSEVVTHSLTDLTDVLRGAGLTQRHGPDAAAWRTIAESLANPDASLAIRAAVLEGHGDARELLAALAATSAGGTPRFPMLRGPKIGPMWIRILAYPGGAEISSIEALPVAVDVQVRKVSEYLEMTATAGLDLERARPLIQAAWDADVEAHGAAGPEPLDGTAAALDPALWFYGKWGCTRCEQARERRPIAPPCTRCAFVGPTGN